MVNVTIRIKGEQRDPNCFASDKFRWYTIDRNFHTTKQAMEFSDSVYAQCTEGGMIYKNCEVVSCNFKPVGQ
ncbi:MAG: hypothetical protein GY922_17105 [Proteobacteria bacterium]|nr:hypothetical protein [Pseudomonadota bacterium]